MSLVCNFSPVFRAKKEKEGESDVVIAHHTVASMPLMSYRDLVFAFIVIDQHKHKPHDQTRFKKRLSSCRRQILISFSHLELHRVKVTYKPHASNLKIFGAFSMTQRPVGPLKLPQLIFPNFPFPSNRSTQIDVKTDYNSTCDPHVSSVQYEYSPTFDKIVSPSVPTEAIVRKLNKDSDS